MSIITLLSIIAGVVGLAGIPPQLIRMARARSAAGQSAVGWSMGAAGNVCMLYVNLVGYQAVLLAVSNVVGFVMCSASIVLITTLNRRNETAARPASGPQFADLPTQEFEVLAAAVRSAAAHRAAPACA
jgi:hypothetical protein